MCSPSLAGNDSRLLKNIERNRDSVWFFCQGKEADVALILQVTRMRKIIKICEANLTSQLLPKTDNHKAMNLETWNKSTNHESQTTTFSTPASKHVKRSAKMIDRSEKPKICKTHSVIQKRFDVNSGQDTPVRYPKSLFWNPTGFHWVFLLRYLEAYSGIRWAGGKETKEFFKKKINNNNKTRLGWNVELYVCRT